MNTTQKDIKIAKLIKEKDELYERIVKQIFSWEVKNGIVSICSAHQIPDANCDICNSAIQAKLKRSSMSVEEIEKVVDRILLFNYEGTTGDPDNGRPVTIKDYYPKGFGNHIAQAIYNAL